MRLSIAKKLLIIANELDIIGLYKEADKLTEMVRVAQMPGQYGWTPNAAVQAPVQPAPTAPRQQPVPTAQPAQSPSYQNWANTIPTSPSLMPPTPYNSPQMPYSPQNMPANRSYQGWYNSGVPANNGNQLQQQLSNMSISPLTVVKTGPDGKQYVQKGQSVQDYMSGQVQNIQNNQQQQSADATVQNARLLQIDREMAEAQTKYWQLEQERRNHQLGDGNIS